MLNHLQNTMRKIAFERYLEFDVQPIDNMQHVQQAFEQADEQMKHAQNPHSINTVLSQLQSELSRYQGTLNAQETYQARELWTNSHHLYSNCNQACKRSISELLENLEDR